MASKAAATAASFLLHVLCQRSSAFANGALQHALQAQVNATFASIAVLIHNSFHVHSKQQLHSA